MNKRNKKKGENKSSRFLTNIKPEIKQICAPWMSHKKQDQSIGLWQTIGSFNSDYEI